MVWGGVALRRVGWLVLVVAGWARAALAPMSLNGYFIQACVRNQSELIDFVAKFEIDNVVEVLQHGYSHVSVLTSLQSRVV